MEKKQYKVLKPIGFYGRREAGEIIEMSDEDFSSFGDEYLEPVAGTVATINEKVETDGLKSPQKRERKSKKQ